MGFVIFTRNPRNKKLIIVETDGDEVFEFATEAEALDAAGDTPVCRAWGYDIVEVPTSTD